MSAREWAEVRIVELLASLFAVSLLIGGMLAGLPFLKERIAEVLLYSVCCISAVFMHAALDLSFRGGRRLVRALVLAPSPEPVLEPAPA
ncbi:MAG TPA: hypothetical protein VIO62_15525 [Candidatus Dormibacteraeota bacterium]|jgi:hypothetical protein